jgi:hypothetical protein
MFCTENTEWEQMIRKKTDAGTAAFIPDGLWHEALDQFTRL